MKQKSGPDKAPAEQVLKNIRRQTRRQYSAEEKIRIVLEGLRGEENISELCRREGIAASMYYGWSGATDTEQAAYHRQAWTACEPWRTRIATYEPCGLLPLGSRLDVLAGLQLVRGCRSSC